MGSHNCWDDARGTPQVQPALSLAVFLLGELRGAACPMGGACEELGLQVGLLSFLFCMFLFLSLVCILTCWWAWAQEPATAWFQECESQAEPSLFF